MWNCVVTVIVHFFLDRVMIAIRAGSTVGVSTIVDSICVTVHKVFPLINRSSADAGE